MGFGLNTPSNHHLVVPTMGVWETKAAPVKYQARALGCRLRPQRHPTRAGRPSCPETYL